MAPIRDERDFTDEERRAIARTAAMSREDSIADLQAHELFRQLGSELGYEKLTETERELVKYFRCMLATDRRAVLVYALQCIGHTAEFAQARASFLGEASQ